MFVKTITKIVYVSCNPFTMVRDIDMLHKRGGEEEEEEERKIWMWKCGGEGKGRRRLEGRIRGMKSGEREEEQEKGVEVVGLEGEEKEEEDVKISFELSGYRCKIVQAVDMFPHTPHVECVALLLRD